MDFEANVITVIGSNVRRESSFEKYFSSRLTMVSSELGFFPQSSTRFCGRACPLLLELQHFQQGLIFVEKMVF